jgi:hypothetical protein
MTSVYSHLKTTGEHLERSNENLYHIFKAIQVIWKEADNINEYGPLVCSQITPRMEWRDILSTLFHSSLVAALDSPAEE